MKLKFRLLYEALLSDDLEEIHRKMRSQNMPFATDKGPSDPHFVACIHMLKAMHPKLPMEKRQASLMWVVNNNMWSAYEAIKREWGV